MGTSNSKSDTQHMKTIYFVRHAQSQSNVLESSFKTYLDADFWIGKNRFDVGIVDPLITRNGQVQIAKLRKLMDKYSFLTKFGIDLIVTSPLTRTMETCDGILQNELSKEENKRNIPPIVIQPDCREYYHSSASRGLSKTQLIQKYNDKDSKYLDYNFEEISDEIWWDKNHETRANFKQRVQRFKKWIETRDEQNIIIVSHCLFIREFLNHWGYVPHTQIIKAELINGKIENAGTIHCSFNNPKVKKELLNSRLYI